MKTLSLLMIAAAGFAAICASTPASAQATRTWVSGVGDDANPCSRTAPCKTFAGAISKTATGGEINCLDPGGFGGVTITKSISIICLVEAGVLVSGTNAIVVNAPAGSKVLLEGLDIEGLGTGLNGVRIIGLGTTTIRNCSIRNFTQAGIGLAGGTNARAVIENSFIINDVKGIDIQGAGGAANNAILQNSVVDNNSAVATQITGPGSLILIGSTLVGSPSAIIATGGATVTSYGNNVIRNSGLPTETLPLQ